MPTPALLARGSGGAAVSLAVLALEETVKAAELAESDARCRATGEPLMLDDETRARWSRHSCKLPSAMLATLLLRPDLLAVFTPDDAFEGLDLLHEGTDAYELWLAPLVEAYAGIRASATALNRLKQRGFYVDVEAGQVVSPEDVTAEQARPVLEAADVLSLDLRSRVETASKRLGPGPLDHG